MADEITSNEVNLWRAFEKVNSENITLKSELERVIKLLYSLTEGVEHLSNCHTGDDYFVAVELLRTPELEAWHSEQKASLEKERLRLLKINALNKLTDEEKQVLGLKENV